MRWKTAFKLIPDLNNSEGHKKRIEKLIKLLLILLLIAVFVAFLNRS